MTEVKFRATVDNITGGTIFFEFGRFQADFNMSSRGEAARKMKLIEGDKIELIVRKK